MGILISWEWALKTKLKDEIRAAGKRVKTEAGDREGRDTLTDILRVVAAPYDKGSVLRISVISIPG